MARPAQAQLPGKTRAGYRYRQFVNAFLAARWGKTQLRIFRVTTLRRRGKRPDAIHLCGIYIASITMSRMLVDVKRPMASPSGVRQTRF
ncbi:uncharacterized protein UV8b_04485 [Ustilaginoidea virens]|uniref:Uncharacterized protein n=1 Tax=Ustilaginoidea virens TaxID=1159556 RepID=A0A8E5HRK0_USTVR|nr:uncharacterized protein UV8b_04485 [Ustilaginoidea virens]QUC20244.1 hypothetical protein UV8b_04485 [Ustilaginoidea virens]